MSLNKPHTQTRQAFTMIELIFVIIVLGILAAMAIPRMDRDLRQEAQDNILSALRYTQNLALSDNKTDPRDANWQKELWQLRFGSYDTGKKWFYTISSDTNHAGNVSPDETFIDPENGKHMYHAAGDATLDETDESPNIFIGKKYGVNSIVFTGDAKCTGNQHIAFDHLGRPYSSINTSTHLYEGYLKTDCTITVGFETSGIPNLVITVEAETGYITAN